MSRSLGPHLPDGLSTLLDGSDLAGRIGQTVLLLTTDESEWPHVAMLSVGELLASADEEIRAALWLHSTATHNLQRTGRAVLMFTCDGAAYYVRARAARGPDLIVGDQGHLAYFALRVEDVLEDAVSYARLTFGITFELHAPEQVVARWQMTIDALRAAGRL